MLPTPPKNLATLGIALLAIGVMAFPGGTSSADSHIEWLDQYGGEQRDIARAAAADASGNVAVAGESWNTSTSRTEAVVRKYDGSGNEAWTRQVAESGVTTRALGIAFDNQARVLVAGEQYNHAFGGTADAFVRVYDSDGNVIWTDEFGVSEAGGSVGARGVGVDSTDNVYVIGCASGVLPGQTYSGDCDAFVRKYDAEGNHLWTRQFGTPRDEFPLGVAVDGADDVYVTGSTRGQLEGQSFSGGPSDAFLVKYDGDGNQLWLRQFGTGSFETGTAVIAGASDEVYVAGLVGNGGVFPGNAYRGGNDAFVRRYDGNGNEVWTRQFGTPQSDEAHSVAIDSDGIVLVGGFTYGALLAQGSAGGSDGFAQKYSSAGELLGVLQFGTPEFDFVAGLDVDGANGIYVAGSTHGSFPGHTNAGAIDAFVAKVNVPDDAPDPAGLCFGMEPTIVGTAGDDFIEGSPFRDVIMGLGGDDTIFGHGGDDVICGGDGNDTIAGNLGNDAIAGGPGDDTVDGGDGHDSALLGGEGHDTVTGGSGNDHVDGGGGNDVLIGNDGNDSLRGRDGDDTMSGNSGNDRILGGPGNDTLNGGCGNDGVHGEEGEDWVAGGWCSADDVNWVSGGPDKDRVFGGHGDDFLWGGGGWDFLYGQGGNDTLFGNHGRDRLRGEAGDDQLSAGHGDDDLDGGADTDTCDGGPGTNTVINCEP